MGNKLTSFKEEKSYQEFEGILFGSVLWLTTFAFALASCLLIIRYFCRERKVYNLAFPANCDCCSTITSILVYAVGLVILALATSPPVTPVCIIVILICFAVTILANGSVLNTIHTNCRHLKSDLHSTLAALFPDLIMKKTHTKSNFKYRETERDGFYVIIKDEGHVDEETPDHMDEPTPEHRPVTIPIEDKEEKQVFLFGDKEFNGENRKIPCCPCLPFYLLHGYTYFYFRPYQINYLFIIRKV